MDNVQEAFNRNKFSEDLKDLEKVLATGPCDPATIKVTKIGTAYSYKLIRMLHDVELGLDGEFLSSILYAVMDLFSQEHNALIINSGEFVIRIDKRSVTFNVHYVNIHTGFGYLLFSMRGGKKEINHDEIRRFLDDFCFPGSVKI